MTDLTDLMKTTPAASRKAAATQETLVGLPMPRDPELVTDPARRIQVTRQRGRRFPFPIPNGWFVVAESRDLAVGDVQPLYYLSLIHI